MFRKVVGQIGSLARSRENVLAYLVNLSINVVGNEDLASMDHAVRSESAVVEGFPFSV